MDWLRRIGDILPTSGESADEPPADSEPEEAGPEPGERATPGAARLFEEVREEEGHAVLDLGPASGPSLRVYQRFAERVRFADLAAGRWERGLAATLRALPADPEWPYDLVFAWDTLDRLRPRERERLIGRLTELTAADARLHAIFDAAEGRTRRRPLRFTLLDVDRVRCEPQGPPRLSREPLLPAEVEDLLSPFEVAWGFTLRGGLREYVGVRGKRGRR